MQSHVHPPRRFWIPRNRAWTPSAMAVTGAYPGRAPIRGPAAVAAAGSTAVAAGERTSPSSAVAVAARHWCRPTWAR